MWLLYAIGAHKLHKIDHPVNNLSPSKSIGVEPKLLEEISHIIPKNVGGLKQTVMSQPIEE
jgi:hypothetical protein